MGGHSLGLPAEPNPDNNRTIGTWLVDHNHQLLLNVTGVYPIPGCKLALKTKQLGNIYTAELTAKEMQNIIYGLPQKPAREVDLQLPSITCLPNELADQEGHSNG